MRRKKAAGSKALVLEQVEPLIHAVTDAQQRPGFQIRGEKVILDSDLARLCGATTKRLNEQVKRNQERFPSDFMFQLTAKESAALRSQIATGSPQAVDLHGGASNWSQIAKAASHRGSFG
jgi:hypothetical protein